MAAALAGKCAALGKAVSRMADLTASAPVRRDGAPDAGEPGDSPNGQCDERQTSEASLHVEYQSAIGRLDTHGDTGRRDLMFVTAAQAAIISIVGDRLMSLDGVRDWALVGVAFAVALLGCNSQWRLRGQVGAFMRRARRIECRLGMSLLHDGDAAFAKRDEQGRPLCKQRKRRSLSADDEGSPALKCRRPASIAWALMALYVLIMIFWVYVACSNRFGGTTLDRIVLAGARCLSVAPWRRNWSRRWRRPAGITCTVH